MAALIAMPLASPAPHPKPMPRATQMTRLVAIANPSFIVLRPPFEANGAEQAPALVRLSVAKSAGSNRAAFWLALSLMPHRNVMNTRSAGAPAERAAPVYNTPA
jgi:hypothetical protein